MSEKDKLDILLYNIFNDNNSHDETKTKKIKLVEAEYNINIEYLYKRYIWLISMEINPNICPLDNNHKLIKEIFREYTKMLNENNIEYYYTSGILPYLFTNKELERYHHDLDIFVNMNDLEKIENVCNKYNFSFERKIGERKNGTKRIMIKMYYSNITDIPITVFMYVREKNNVVIQKDYFIDKNNHNHVEYIYNSSVITELSFSDVPKTYNDIQYYSITPEALFLCKTGNRQKDIYDCTILKKIINNEKFKKLEQEFKHCIPNTTVEAKYDDFSNYIFKNINMKRVLSNYDRL